MLNVLISQAVLIKLETKHDVTKREVEQCFMNREGALLIDDREQHRTMPPTRWFIAATNQGRLLKIIFVSTTSGLVELKSAFEPNDTELDIYRRHA